MHSPISHGWHWSLGSGHSSFSLLLFVSQSFSLLLIPYSFCLLQYESTGCTVSLGVPMEHLSFVWLFLSLSVYHHPLDVFRCHTVSWWPQLMVSAVSCSGPPAEPAGTGFTRNIEDEEDISKMTPKTLKLYHQLPTQEYRWHYNLQQTISNNFYSSYFYSNFLKTHLKSQKWLKLAGTSGDHQVQLPSSIQIT